ncbi:MAG: class II aldolase/adducin family protein [Deltaproteobacteria bacterium]|nr:class II aldolase/adducin family protein [Deltaproteobacteria bacterium]
MSKCMEIVRLRKELSDFSIRSFNRGLVSGTGGNMSVRIPGTDEVLITPTGISLGDITPEMNLLMRLDGTVLESPWGLKSSKETGFHLAAYQLRPETGAVAHLHPPYATAYSNKMKPLPLVTVSARGVLKEVPWIESAPAGSAELSKYVQDGLRTFPAQVRLILMREHGTLALGSDLSNAYYLTDLAEDTAKIAFVEGNIQTV